MAPVSAQGQKAKRPGGCRMISGAVVPQPGALRRAALGRHGDARRYALLFRLVVEAVAGVVVSLPSSWALGSW